jgi:hypothetical protein
MLAMRESEGVPMSGCTHNEPRLSPVVTDELAGLLPPATLAVMLATVQRLAEGAGPGSLAEGWQLLAATLTDAHELAVYEWRDRGAP